MFKAVYNEHCKINSSFFAQFKPSRFNISPNQAMKDLSQKWSYLSAMKNEWICFFAVFFIPTMKAKHMLQLVIKIMQSCQHNDQILSITSVSQTFSLCWVLKKIKNTRLNWRAFLINVENFELKTLVASSFRDKTGYCSS